MYYKEWAVVGWCEVPEEGWMGGLGAGEALRVIGLQFVQHQRN